MSEKRKPTFVYLAKNLKQKKTYKIEVFPASLWVDNFKPWDLHLHTFNHNIYNAYRLRVNGKWFKLKNGQWLFWKSEIRDLLFNSFKRMY